MVNQQPLQALLVAPGKRDRDRITSGKITCTIRPGSRQYQTGPVMLCCHIKPWCVKAQIIGVFQMQLRSVSLPILQMAGYKSYGDALKGIRRFYTNFSGYQLVSVIMWDRVEGKLVDQRRPKKKLPKWLQDVEFLTRRRPVRVV